jgi:hypothetical protein
MFDDSSKSPVLKISGPLCFLCGYSCSYLQTETSALAFQNDQLKAIATLAAPASHNAADLPTLLRLSHPPMMPTDEQRDCRSSTSIPPEVVLCQHMRIAH